MKPTILVVAVAVTSFVLGLGAMQFYSQPSLATNPAITTPEPAREPNPEPVPEPTPDPVPTPDPFAEPAPAPTPTPSHTVPMDRPKIKLKNWPARSQTVNVKPAIKPVEAVGIQQRLMKRDGSYEYWGWRVDVKNNTNRALTVYVEVEWLDRDGFRVEYANEVRTIEPGQYAISDVHIIHVDEAAKIKNLRIVQVSGR